MGSDVRVVRMLLVVRLGYRKKYCESAMGSDVRVVRMLLVLL